jgi:hypothetical protein
LWVPENGGLKTIRMDPKRSGEHPKFLVLQEFSGTFLDFSTETFFILWIILYVSGVTNQPINNMNARPFPGAPDGFNLVLSKQLSDSSEALNSRDNEASQGLASIYQGLALCLLASRAYFDLFMKIGSYYQELTNHWSKEVLSKNPSPVGLSLVAITKADVDTTIINDLDGDSFHVLTSLVMFTQDKAIINNPDTSGPMTEEQMLILNQILWAIYIGLFSKEHFDRNVRVFTEAYKQAKVELEGPQKYSVN